MVYKIPMEDVKSLAKSFAQLESGKKWTHKNYTVFMKNIFFLTILLISSQLNRTLNLKSTTSPSQRLNKYVTMYLKKYCKWICIYLKYKKYY